MTETQYDNVNENDYMKRLQTISEVVYIVYLKLFSFIKILQPLK